MSVDLLAHSKRAVLVGTGLVKISKISKQAYDDLFTIE